MKAGSFDIPLATPELKARALERAQELRAKLKGKPTFASALQTRRSALGIVSYLRLEILRREFTGRYVPGLTFLVRFARNTVQKYRTLRLRIRPIMPGSRP